MNTTKNWNAYVIKINDKEDFTSLTEYLLNNNYKPVEDNIRGKTWKDSITYIVVVPKQPGSPKQSNNCWFICTVTLAGIERAFNVLEVFNNYEDFINSGILEAMKMGLLSL